mgnify:FL=1
MLNKMKVTFSLFLLTVLFLMIDYESLKNVANKISLVVFYELLVLQTIALLLNTYKWNMFIPELRLKTLIKFNLITFFYNIVLPGQGVGEVAKIYKMRNILPTNKIVTSVILERVFSLFTALLVCGYGLYFTDYQYSPSLMFAVFLTIIFIAIVLWTIKVMPFESIGIVTKIFNSHLSDKINNGFLKFSKGVKCSLTFYTASMNTILGIMAQLLNVAMVIVISKSIGLNISFVDWCWIFSIIGVALILPISFAGLGVREGLFTILILQFDGNIEDGIVISLTLFAIQIVFAIIGWMLDLRKLNYSFHN